MVVLKWRAVLLGLYKLSSMFCVRPVAGGSSRGLVEPTKWTHKYHVYMYGMACSESMAWPVAGSCGKEKKNCGCFESA